MIADPETLAEARIKMERSIHAQHRFGDEIEAFGHQLIRDHAALDEKGQVIWTEELVRFGGWIGYRTLCFAAKNGCTKSAMYLMDRAAGAPEQPFRVRLESEGWTADDALNEMYRRLTVGQGLSDQKARAEIKLMTGEDLPALPTAYREDEVPG